MNKKKGINAFDIYYNELRSRDLNISRSEANQSYQTLDKRTKDKYVADAKRRKELNSSARLANKKDTLGNDLQDVDDQNRRLEFWKEDSRRIIEKIAKDRNVMKKVFYVATISGAEFVHPSYRDCIFVPSEITIIKFTFSTGIINSLVLFPDPIAVPSGYRQSLYEELEERVGWKPDTFQSNQTIQDCIRQIRTFFGKDIDTEPIYVPTWENALTVGMGLHTLYKENREACPWIESHIDWGANTKIFQLEYLVSYLLMKRSIDDSAKEDFKVSMVLDYWRKVVLDYASEPCERHSRYGLSNQCATNIVRKYLYMSFTIMSFILEHDMDDLQNLVSESFYRNVDFVLPPEAVKEVEEVKEENLNNSNWNDYYMKTGIEETLSQFDGVTLHDGVRRNTSNYFKEGGRGRGRVTQNSQPGNNGPTNKLKLPNVIC